MLTLRNLLVLGLLYSFNISYSHGYMLSLSLNELTTVLGGSGKAKQFWNFIRNGDDPLLQSENLSLVIITKYYCCYEIYWLLISIQ